MLKFQGAGGGELILCFTNETHYRTKEAGGNVSGSWRGPWTKEARHFQRLESKIKTQQKSNEKEYGAENYAAQSVKYLPGDPTPDPEN